jgi:hypothetical protein
MSVLGRARWGQFWAAACGTSRSGFGKRCQNRDEDRDAKADIAHGKPAGELIEYNEKGLSTHGLHRLAASLYFVRRQSESSRAAEIRC